MKKVLLVLLSIIFITGCEKTKTVYSAEDFVSIMNENHYKYTDVSDKYSYANNAYQYKTNKPNVDIFYLEGDNAITIKGMYSDECNNVRRGNPTESEAKVRKGDNYSTFEITYNNTYYYLAWVEGTFLKIECALTEKADMQKIIEKMGY